MLRRSFAFLLAFLMLFSSVPTQALATMIGEESQAEALVVIGSDETSAPVETTAAAENVPAPQSETTVPETTVGETVPATTAAEETVPETTVEETVPATTAAVETVPETTEEETVPATTAAVETVPETTTGETVPETTEETVEEIFDEDISNDPAQAVEEPALTENWAADTLAIAQAYYDAGYTQETDADGNPYTVFGEYFEDADATTWNAYFAGYCIDKAYGDDDQTIVPMPTSGLAADWVGNLTTSGLYQPKNSGYTPAVGDLVFWTNYWPVVQNVGIIASVTDAGWTKNIQILLADDGGVNKEGTVGIFETTINDGRINGYARIPTREGLMGQTLTGKVYTDDTYTTEDASVAVTVEGMLPPKSEVRVYPRDLTAAEKTALGVEDEPTQGYHVALFVDGEERTTALSEPVSVTITAPDFGDYAVSAYSLSNKKLMDASFDSTVTLSTTVPGEFAFVGEIALKEQTLTAKVYTDATHTTEATNMTATVKGVLPVNGEIHLHARDLSDAEKAALGVEDEPTQGYHVGVFFNGKERTGLLSAPVSITVSTPDNFGGYAVSAYGVPGEKLVDATFDDTVKFDAEVPSDFAFVGGIVLEEQTLTAKVYTDATHTTEATNMTATVKGVLPVNGEIRIHPETPAEGKTAAYRVSVYFNDKLYELPVENATVTINDKDHAEDPLKITVDGVEEEKMQLGAEISVEATLPSTFEFEVVTSATVSTAEELKAAVEAGVPEIILGENITVDADNDNITVSKAVKIELNGKNLVAAGDNALFNISGSGNLTMEDNGTETVTKSAGTKLSRPDSVDDAALGSVAKADSGKAVLTYYTTQSVDALPAYVYDNGATNEYRYQHTVTAAGMVENKSTQPLFSVNGGTLNINGGTYVGNLDGGYSGRGIVQSSGAANLNGGYLAGFNFQPSRTDWSNLNDFGGAIRATGGSLNIGTAVIAANQAISGAGVYAENTAVTLENGVISGNKATGESSSVINDNGGPHFGGAGVYLGEHSTITINGADSYITNNSAPQANGYADGGAAIFARKWTTITINAGYITSNTVGGGGGAIRTIYGTETDYANMSSEAVKQAVEMAIYINGGYICGNFCRYAEGGGVSVNAGTGCWLTAGYINNNATLTQRDWGGGGLFNANGSYLELKNVLITENTALGLGGGVGGCSTGDIHLAVTEGGALFDNTGMGQNWSGEGSQKREDVELAGENPNFDMENADDYFCVHNSKVEAQMLGRGSCDWVGTCDDEKVTPPQRTVLEATKVMGLTSYAMAPGKMEARMNAKAYINGNYSNVHGGGIMCNGVLDVGTPMVGPLPAWLEVVGTKVFNSNTPMTSDMFTFILDAEGNVVCTGTNDANGKISFGQQLVFEEVGTYTYTIHEQAGTDENIEYDSKVYTMVVTTKADADGNICFESVTVDGTAVEGIEENSIYVTLPSDTFVFRNTAVGKINVQAHKVWEDDNNRDGKRPVSIEVELYADGVATGKKLELSNTDSSTGSNNWHGQFLNLDKYDAEGNLIEYTVKEVSVPAGYTVAYTTDEDEGSLVITNSYTPETTSITATKVWEDNSNQDGIRPASIVLTLYADGEAYVDDEGNGRTITLNGSGNTWTGSITGLPKYKNVGGEVSEIVYSLEETVVPEGYTAVEAGTTVTNTHIPEETEVSFRKNWEDAEDQDGKRPDSITVNLYSGEGENKTLVDSMTVTAETNYGGTFGDLPKYANGVQIVYTLEEEPVEGYETSITGSAADGFEITNTHEVEEIDLSVKKVWKDFGNQDGLRPRSITVQLLVNGAAAGDPVELNADNSWTHSWTKLPQYAGGERLKYSVVEIAHVDAAGNRNEGTPAGYTVTHSYENNLQAREEDIPEIWTDATITNTLTPELTTLNIQKQWDDDNNRDGLRPTSIKLTLWKTTVEPAETVTSVVGGVSHTHYVVDPSEESGWVHAKDSEGNDIVKEMTPKENGTWDTDFERLPKYEVDSENDTRKLIYYAVTEEVVGGYTSSAELDPGTNVLYLKNTHKTEETEITVSKVWDDADNQDGIRPASITVSLFGRDKTQALETITLPYEGKWSYTWTGLDKNYNGTPIIYTVVETAVPGYNVDVTGNVTAAADASGNIQLTNTHIPELTSIPVTKVWEDAKNQDGMRPEAITVILLADGVQKQSQILTADDNWSYTFTNLPKFANGKQIVYTVDEAEVKGYTKKIEGTTITNTHIPETTSVPFTKVWDDAENQDAKRPASVTITLYADGTAVQTKTVTAAESWSGEFTDLPVYRDGNKIKYTVGEAVVDVPGGYTATVIDNTIINTYKPEKTQVTITKTWADAGNQDGIRPETITVHLLADGIEVASATYDATTNASYTFTNLNKYKNVNGTAVEIVYTVTEDPVPGYETTISGLSITNTHVPEETEFSVKKQWEDNNDQDGIRPASIQVQLYADGSAEGEAVTLNAGNNWSYTWTGLDKYKNVNGKGVAIQYSADETEVPEGYTKVVDGGIITNTHAPEETEITTSKIWDDANDQDGIRTDSVTVQLYADGTAVGDPVALNAANHWSKTWSGLPKYRNVDGNGVAIVYTVKETAIPGYNLVDGVAQSITASADAQGNAVLTNVHIPEQTQITVVKVWNGQNNDGTQPDAVRVTLYGNDKVVEDVFLDESNNWEYTWNTLPKFEEGELVDYQILETGYKDGETVIIGELPDGYSVNHTISGSTVTVTNTYTPEKTFMNVQKTWEDTNNQDGLRVKAVQVTLMADGVSTGKTAVLYEGNHWDYTFEDLEKNSEEGAIVYTIVETGYYNVYNPENPSDGLVPGVPAGYSATYDANYSLKTIELINTHEVEKTSVPVRKVWTDAEDQDGIRPEEITVTLYANGEPAPANIIEKNTAVLNEENGWSYTFEDLPVHHGIALKNVYTVKEESVTGYTATTTGDAKNGYVLTNSHVPEVVDIPVTKTWDDAENQDNLRPDTITVILLADGTEIDRQTIGESDNWSYTFEDLPKFEDGTEIEYTVDEVAVNGYETEIDGYNITNTHKPDVTSVTANKVWVDNNNQDGKRPASIKLHLLANGKHTGVVAELKPDANGDWSYTWEDLPKYDDGVEIDYAVMEEAIGNGYYTTIDDYTVTNTYAPEKTSINVWKHWDDGNNQDNLRPESITVELWANDKATGKTLTLNADSHWYGSFSGLDKFEAGEPIAYSVKETAVTGYAPGTVTGSAAEGFTITNKREVEKTEISVTKVWEDENDRDGLRPESVTVTLYRDGVATDSSVELSAANGWAYTWEDLDVNHGQGIKYRYSVVETVPAGYEAITTGSAATGYVITNKRDTDTTSIPVIKVWDDALNQDGKRPASIKVELLADGVKTGKTLTLTAAVNWQGVFTDLPVNNAKDDSTAEAKPIRYEVLETAVAEYNVDKDGVAQELIVPVVDGKITIVNKHDVEVTKLNVRKVWSDFNNNDGKRPYAVVITLHENGKPTDKTLTLSNENSWKGAWDKMPRYSGGVWIAYSVVETGYYQTEQDLKDGNLTLGVPSGYEVSHSYDSKDTSNPVATVTNTYAPETTGLNVQKRWDDDNNREGIRPTEITVTLYRKVGENGTWSVVEDNEGNELTVVLNVTNHWDADFLGLPRYSGGELIYYNVVETPVAGYEPTYKLDPATGVVTVTNTNEINKDVEIAVSKVWEDKEDQDRIRPAEIEVTLYANGIKTSSTKTLNAANGWKAEWTGLYEYYKGSKIVYTVVEENVPAGYKAKVTGDASTGFVITNTHEVETVDIPVAKIWDDKNNQDGIRPESITVTLLADGETTGKTLTLNAENLWKGTFADLDKYNAGAEIEYSIREAAVAGYNVDKNGKAQDLTVPVVNGKIELTNVHAPDKTTLTAIKKWHDNDDQDGKRPASVTVHLLANGVHMGKEYARILSEENNWTYTWKDLEKYVSGQPIIYTVYEEPVEFKKSEIEAEAENDPTAIDHYVADYVRDSETQVTINNRYTPETTSISAIKVWNDDDNRDGLRTDKVEVKLLADGEAFGQIMTMDAANNWTAVWTNLPKYKDQGKLINYTVEEVNVPTGYINNVSTCEDVENTYIVTNSHTSVTTGIKVTKAWVDENDLEGHRPDGVIVQLYADGNAVEGGRVVLNEENKWTATYQSTEKMPLYVYNAGKLITYHVQEIGYVVDGVEFSGMPAGYQGKTTLGENNYAFVITNTRESAKMSVTVNKVWADGGNADGIRPASIEITLLKNGAAVNTVTLNAENNWSYTWNGLNKFEGGAEVKYTVSEVQVNRYTANYTYTTSADGKTITATVTNAYEPTSKWFAIQKVWNDKNNAEGLRPSAVTVQIFKNGQVYGDPIVLTAGNNWQSPMRLPVYENGVEIKWTIQEINIPKYYTVSYDQNTLTVTNSIQSKEVPKTGDDSNMMLWVGLLGLCGAGAITVLFAGKKKKRSK